MRFRVEAEFTVRAVSELDEITDDKIVQLKRLLNIYNGDCFRRPGGLLVTIFLHEQAGSAEAAMEGGATLREMMAQAKIPPVLMTDIHVHGLDSWVILPL